MYFFNRIHLVLLFHSSYEPKFIKHKITDYDVRSLRNNILAMLCQRLSEVLFPLEHTPSSHSHLYSILLTLLYILPLLTQVSCVCLPKFWLFCLCIYDLVFLFCCLFVYFCVLVFSLLLVFFCFAGTARLSRYSHISLLANKEIRRQHLYRLDPKSTKSTIIQMQKTLQAICRAC